MKLRDLGLFLTFGLLMTACGSTVQTAVNAPQHKVVDNASIVVPTRMDGGVSATATQTELPSFGLDRRAAFCLYEDINYRGNAICFVLGSTDPFFKFETAQGYVIDDLASINPALFWNDRVSSVKVLNGLYLTLWSDASENGSPRGRSVSFTKDVPDLRAFNFNDVASSVVIANVVPANP